MESYLSYRYGLLSQAAFEEIRNVILRYYKNVIKDFSASQIKKIVELCLLDKKNVNGKINITMLESIGHATPNHFVTIKESEEAIIQMNA